MKTRLLLTFALLQFVCICSKADLVINEIMQSNIDCVMDDLNEFPDSWVELYNPGTTSINLSSYKIGDSKNPSKAYQLPSVNVASNGFILIYCDKENKNLHTDFRLDSGKGGGVWLFKGQNIVDEVSNWKKQPAPNIAYGRKTDGANEWGYQKKPTPKASNCGELVTKILGEPVFSEPGRVLSSSSGRIDVHISLPDDAPEGTKIRVTYDGSEPTETSTLFTSNATYTVTSSKVIRAKLFCDGYMSPRSTTHSYIFHGRNVTLPVISISTDDKYYHDKKVGIYYSGKGYSQTQENYKYDWRRPINFEYFEGTNTGAILNQLTETRLMGGGSRRSDISSQIIYANKRFGVKRLEHEFFPEDRPGVKDFKSIILRNGGNDFDYTYMRDALIQRTMAKTTDVDYQAYHPAIIYFNGTYKGMLNIRERSQEDNIYTNYDGLEDFDMVENWSEVKNGDMNNLNAFQTFISETGHTKEEYDQWMDTEEYISYMIAGLYFNNTDWPGNNFMMWRPLDGKWRFLMKDCEYSIGLYGQSGERVDFNTIKWINTPNYENYNTWANTSEKTRLFRRLMTDESFKTEFMSHAAIYMGDFLNKTWIDNNVLTPMYNKISYEYPYHRKLVNQWWPNFSEEVGKLRTWINQRNNYFYKYLAEYYNWGTPTPLTVNMGVNGLEDIEVTMNGIKLTQGTFNGKFWQDREVTVEGVSTNDRIVVGWNITKTAANGDKNTYYLQGKKYTFKMPSCSKYEINVQFGILGDANMDSKIDVADITAIAAYILNPDEEISGFNMITADVNKDGQINVADITSVAAKILGQ